MKKVIAIFFFTSLINFWITPQENGQFIYQTKELDIPFTITQFATKHGLPQNQVLNIIKLPNQKIALSTANGIVQFDGKNFSDLTKDKDNKNTIFSHLFYEKKTKKTYGLKFGGDFFVLTPKVKLISKCRFVCQNENLFYGVMPDGSIVTIDSKNSKTKLISETKIKDPQQICINFPNIYIAGANGVIQYNLLSTKQKYFYFKFIHRVKKINSTLFFMSHRELFKFDENKNKFELIFSSNVPEISFSDVEQINSNEYFIATNQGLIHINKAENRCYLKKDGMPSEYLNSLLYLQAEKSLLVGTGQQGLLKLNLKYATNIFKPSNFILNSLNSVVEYEGNVLVSSMNGNIFNINKKEATLYAHFFSNFASCSVINDTLALGTWGAGIILVKNKKKQKIVTNGINDLNVHSVFSDSKKRIWIGTNSGISIGRNFSNLKHFKNTKGRVICFYELKNKSICVGTSDGFYIISSNLRKSIFVGRKHGFYGKEVRCFYEDFEGKIWVGTYNGGMFCYHNKKLTSINSKKNCNLPIDVFCFAKDKRGQIYFSGNLGLNCVNFKKLNDFYYNKIDYLIPFYFGEKSGIYNTEFNGGFQNNYLKKNDIFYFPSIEGITIFKPRKISNSNTKIHFQNIYVNDTLSNFNRVKFPPEIYSLTFEFNKVNFNPSNSVFYQYSIEKNNIWQDWSPMQKNNSISFKSLSPGKYKLKVRALDSFMSNKDVLYYQFQIKPYFYQTWYFYAIIALSLVFAGGFFVRWRMKLGEKRNKFNNKINNQILELKLAAIQAKMNPHFIFNVLNNIKYLLMIDKKNEAENLVDDFSILLRKFLSYNDKYFNTIKDEIEFIQLYVNIEKSRLNNKFEFNLFVRENLTHKIIPTMLIQPFIENAIKHGIAHSEKKCFLNLSIDNEGDFIIFTIEDNGIGMEASKSMRTTNQQHQSKGINLVTEKIENLKLKYHVFVNLNIMDIDFMNDTGTIVKLKILIENEDELRNN